MVHDPFSGGGTIPLAAKTFGLHAIASDLNPVALLINKSMLDLPRAFADMKPLEMKDADHLKAWKGFTGLAEDVRRFGEKLIDNLESKIGHLFPPCVVGDADANRQPELAALRGKALDLVATLKCWSVRSPSPAHAHLRTPLVSTFVLVPSRGARNGLRLVLRMAKSAFL